MKTVNEYLDRAKGKVCAEGWAEANEELRGKTWAAAIRHPRAAEWIYWHSSRLVQGRWKKGEKVLQNINT